MRMWGNNRVVGMKRFHKGTSSNCDVFPSNTAMFVYSGCAFIYFTFLSYNFSNKKDFVVCLLFDLLIYADCMDKYSILLFTLNNILGLGFGRFHIGPDRFGSRFHLIN